MVQLRLMRPRLREKGEYGVVPDLKKLLWKKFHESSLITYIRTQNLENRLDMMVTSLRASLEARRAGGF
jgi:hypothetical protein